MDDFFINQQQIKKAKSAPARSSTSSSPFFAKLRAEAEAAKPKSGITPAAATSVLKKRRTCTPFASLNRTTSGPISGVAPPPSGFIGAPKNYTGRVHVQSSETSRRPSARHEALMKRKRTLNTDERKSQAALAAYRMCESRLNVDQRAVIAEAARGTSIFLSGGAGVGKSYALRCLVLEQQSRGRRVAVCAATGCAAVQIGGTTLHSWAGIGLGKGTQSQLLAHARRFKENWTGVDVLVLDEVSMISFQLFEALDYIGRILRRKNSEPFGGLQVVLCGDFHQLPPVGVDGLYAFNSKLWDEMFVPANVFVLTRVYRQSGDLGLYQILQRIRSGDVTSQDLDTLNSNCLRPLGSSGGILATKLLCTNVEVDSINHGFLKRLRSTQYEFKCADSFRYASPQGNRDPGKTLAAIAAHTVVLKVGAQVLLTRNLDIERGLCNGSRGVVVGYRSSSMFKPPPNCNALLKRWYASNALTPIVRFLDNVEITVEPVEHTSVTRDVRVARVQLPLALAWAVTVHRSQGLSLDMAQLDLSSSFAQGQAYVALSRVRSMRGLQLVKPLKRSNIKTSSSVSLYYQKMTGDAEARPGDVATTDGSQRRAFKLHTF